jgi:hypothetical protein
MKTSTSNRSPGTLRNINYATTKRHKNEKSGSEKVQNNGQRESPFPGSGPAPFAARQEIEAPPFPPKSIATRTN